MGTYGELTMGPAEVATPASATKTVLARTHRDPCQVLAIRMHVDKSATRRCVFREFTKRFYRVVSVRAEGIH